MDLFDAQCGALATEPGRTRRVAVDELLQSMDDCGITGALVRVAPGTLETDVDLANRRLFDACKPHDQLIPCPVVVPNSAGDLPSEEQQAADALANGAGAVWVRPSIDDWIVADWLCAPLFDALEAKHLPVFADAGMIDFHTMAAIAAKWPRLPFIYAGLHYRDQRKLVPLLRNFPNVHASIGSNYTVHSGLEHMVAQGLAKQLLFGTGFPESEPAAAVMLLACSPVSDADRQAIAAGNLVSLVAGAGR
ncbi:MAG: amidohydrolase family protein [Planctomycetes bacterium]|nr:amidohydrolase family protein [Planctomycetota bacterium]